jgi:hypothetical protein
VILRKVRNPLPFLSLPINKVQNDDISYRAQAGLSNRPCRVATLMATSNHTMMMTTDVLVFLNDNGFAVRATHSVEFAWCACAGSCIQALYTV